MDNRSLAAAGIAAGIGVQAFGLFLPPAMALRLDLASTDRQDKFDDVRAGEVFAFAATVALCAIVARYEETPVPLLAGAAAALAMVAVYEWTLRGDRS